MRRYKNNSRVVYHPISKGEKDHSLQDKSVMKLFCYHVKKSFSLDKHLDHQSQLPPYLLLSIYALWFSFSIKLSSSSSIQILKN